MKFFESLDNFTLAPFYDTKSAVASQTLPDIGRKLILVRSLPTSESSVIALYFLAKADSVPRFKTGKGIPEELIGLPMLLVTASGQYSMVIKQEMFALTEKDTARNSTAKFFFEGLFNGSSYLTRKLSKQFEYDISK